MNLFECWRNGNRCDEREENKKQTARYLSRSSILSRIPEVQL
ncbi:unnamed protein product [Linum tenue]|uniref:Uncharacterized protein n=1 Tax=Linum tenue TaxID=586396 RepID=A0AAV0RI61_9ROSI|nr:unnamed protein product [Linum tenue]